MQTIDIPMFDDVKLIESSDSLELALAQMGKYSLDNSFNSDILSKPSAIGAGNGFDDWLAADLNFGALSSDESSLSSSPFSGMEDSPDLGFDSYGSMDPSLFDMSMAFPDLTSAEESAILPESEMSAIPVSGLTASAVQQAAAALNIPWSKDLEKAVMAQAAMGAVAVPAPAAAAVPASPLGQTMDSPMLIPKDEPVESDFSSLSSYDSVSSRSVSLSPSPSPSSEESSSSATATPKKSKKRVLSPSEREGEIVAKRAKNTDAARRSRLKKLIRLEGLEAKVSDLESANSTLNMKIAILETEKSGYLTKEAEQAARIDQLEAQLAEAHAALARI